MNKQPRRVQTDIEAIVAVIARLMDLPSNWNGEVDIVHNADFKGKKRFSCGIEIHADLINRQSRWSTLIHEAVHCFSAGYTASSYWDFPGWEEGVVEQLQRLCRSAVLETLEITVDKRIFLILDAEHRYNRYITALETLRVFLNAEPLEFYYSLLHIPIRERPVYMLQRSRSLDSEKRKEFLRLFSVANSVLKQALEVYHDKYED